MGQNELQTGLETWGNVTTNNLIQNFKKPMDRRGTAQWRWKEQAVQDASAALNAAFGNASLAGITFVPIPPSKVKADQMYDDRMLRMLRGVRQGLDIRELVIQRTNRAAAHDTEDRPRPETMAAQYMIDEELAAPAPATIIVCDDIVTTGCQFMAMRSVLTARYPQAEIFGVFLARRAPQYVEFDDFEL